MKAAEKRTAGMQIAQETGTAIAAESEQDSREPNAAGMEPGSPGVAFAASDLPGAEPQQERRTFYGSMSTVHRRSSLKSNSSGIPFL